MYYKLGIRKRATRFIQPQLVNNPVDQREHEANQEYVGRGNQLPVVLRSRHVEPQRHSYCGVTQCPYQKSSIEVHCCLQSSGNRTKIEPSKKNCCLILRTCSSVEHHTAGAQSPPTGRGRFFRRHC